MKLSRWKAKAIVQKVISFLPMKEQINLLFQKYVTKGVWLTEEHFEGKLLHARDHLHYFREYGSVREDFSVLELGTGWYPVIPISMYLSGAQSVLSMDIQSWMSKKSMLETIRYFLAWKESGKIFGYLHDTRPERWETLQEIADHEERYDRESICCLIHLTLVLGDGRKSPIPPGSIDYICSNNTFEHVHESVLRGLLAKFAEIIKDGGVMSHFIDMSDHFAHFDRDINIYNFLKYSDKFWKRLDNDIQPQNRLRFPDYLQMYGSLHLPVTEYTTRPGNPEELARIPLAKEFRHYAPEDLAISHAHLVSKM